MIVNGSGQRYGTVPLAARLKIRYRIFSLMAKGTVPYIYRKWLKVRYKLKVDNIIFY